MSSLTLLAKDYFWRGMVFPGFHHNKFVLFLRALATCADFHEMFGYRRKPRFELRKNSIFDLATRIQNLAPAHGNDGPNPEYPWPPKLPTTSPLVFPYLEWRDSNETTAGRRLGYFVQNLLSQYLHYFP